MTKSERIRTRVRVVYWCCTIPAPGSAAVAAVAAVVAAAVVAAVVVSELAVMLVVQHS